MTITATRYGYDPKHPLFRVPSHGTSIWRYTPLTKLIRLLEAQRLHLCRASRLTEDPFEGTVTARSEADLVEWEVIVQASPEDRAFLRAERKKAREAVAVSCWHKATHETEGMWVRYGGGDECVAIRSTIGMLIASLPQPRDPERMDLESVYVGEVEYIDFSSDTFPLHNVFYPFVHKRREFHHEQEVRVVALITDEAERDSKSGAATGFQVTEMGMLLPLDVRTLIEAVILSPKASLAFEHEVRAHLDGLGYSAIPTQKSAMSGVPIY